ncbi:hypothetical protein [Leifsonia poae]|uniref:hypothetical protein n=1 Tax=Leifsonia poae TaxID=110933 RepID=UPI001CBED954|nr:hypothetical protein [Leifsonia poae]
MEIIGILTAIINAGNASQERPPGRQITWGPLLPRVEQENTVEVVTLIISIAALVVAVSALLAAIRGRRG